MLQQREEDGCETIDGIFDRWHRKTLKKRDCEKSSAQKFESRQTEMMSSLSDRAINKFIFHTGRVTARELRFFKPRFSLRLCNLDTIKAARERARIAPSYDINQSDNGGFRDNVEARTMTDNLLQTSAHVVIVQDNVRNFARPKSTS